MNTTATPIRVTSHAIRALLTLAEPGTRLLLVDKGCCLIGKRTTRSLSTKTYNVLYYAEWITHPQAIGAGVAECTLTDLGHAAAAKIRAEMSQYCQLALFSEDKEEEAA